MRNSEWYANTIAGLSTEDFYNNLALGLMFTLKKDAEDIETIMKESISDISDMFFGLKCYKCSICDDRRSCMKCFTERYLRIDDTDGGTKKPQKPKIQPTQTNTQSNIA